MNPSESELKNNNLKSGFWNKLDSMTRVFLIVMVILILGILAYNIFYHQDMKKVMR